VTFGRFSDIGLPGSAQRFFPSKTLASKDKESMEEAGSLLLYADKTYLAKQLYPFGLDVIAACLRRKGRFTSQGRAPVTGSR